jgi:RHS repeat-associated protein
MIDFIRVRFKKKIKASPMPASNHNYRNDQVPHIRSGGYDMLGNSADFDAEGRMTGYANRNNVKVSFDRDGDRIVAVRDNTNALVMGFGYTGQNLTSITDRTNRQVLYQWTNNRLTQVTDVLGYLWKYQYNNDGQLLKMTDPELRETSVSYVTSYPAAGIAVPLGISFSGKPGRDFRISRVATFKNSLNEERRYSYEYDRQRGEFVVIETTPAPINRRLEMRYDYFGRLLQSENGDRKEYERRRDGPLVDYVKDERGMVTRTERDGFRNVISVLHPNGTEQTWKYHPRFNFVTESKDEEGHRSTYAYDAKGNRIEMIDAVGTAVERKTTYEYDSFGQMIKRTIKGATVADDVITQFEYDAYGNTKKTIDPEGHVVEYTYDVMGNTLTRKDARGNTSSMTYNAAGWMESSTTNLGFTSTVTYDKVGNRKTSTTPISATETATTIYRYDRLDRLIETEDPLGGISKQSYDEEGRMKQSEDARGVITKLEYDSTSRLIKVIDGNQNVVETVYGDESNALEGLVAKRIYPTYEETYKYDERDQVKETTQVLSSTTSYTTYQSYSATGQIIATIDAKLRTSQRFYDELDRLIKDIDPLMGTTLYAYDHRDNLIAVTDANGNRHEFTYDKMNRKLTEKRPMGQTIQYRYDPNGNLIERISPNLAKRKYTYDLDNRLTKEEHFLPKNTNVSKTNSYTYDRRGLLLTYSDGLTAGSYTYNKKGEKTNESVVFGSGANAISKTLQRTYEANGLLKSLTYPDGSVQRYTYDPNNQLLTYKIPGLPANNDTLSYEYRWNSINKITMPGNLTRTITLDPLQRPAKIEVKRAGSNPATIMDHRYSFDEVSNITKKSTLDGDYVYDYDKLDRLTEATPPSALTELPKEKYNYDGVHNRLFSQHQIGSWNYNPNNELLSWGVAAEKRQLTYDLNGSTTREELGDPVTARTDYVYDAQDRLIEVKKDGTAVAKYAYDPMGQRVKRETFGSEPSATWYFYSDEGLIGEYLLGGQAIREYGWNPGGMWGTDTVWQKDSNGVFLTSNDYLYTTDLLTNAGDGHIAWSALRESFGQTSVRNNSGTAYLMRFPGQWEDVVTGFAQNWNREYVNARAGYLSTDPALPSGSSPHYAYASQNPIVQLDPNGLFSWNPADWALDSAAFAAERKHRKSGTVYQLRFVTLCCLAEIYGKTVWSVTVRENSTLPKWQDDFCRGVTRKKNEGTRCQDTYATTRKRSIYLDGSGAQFEQKHATLLHEFFHVIRQWDTGRMTRREYLLNPQPWEDEAEAAESEVPRFEKCLEENCGCPLIAN